MRLTGYLESLLDEVAATRPVAIVTPRDPTRRGAQLSVRVRTTPRSCRGDCARTTAWSPTSASPTSSARAGAAVLDVPRLLAGGDRAAGVARCLTGRSDAGVVVVGAGLAGCLLACFLARRGLRVTLYERRGDPRPERPARRGRTGPLDQPRDLRARPRRAAADRPRDVRDGRRDPDARPDDPPGRRVSSTSSSTAPTARGRSTRSAAATSTTRCSTPPRRTTGCRSTSTTALPRSTRRPAR